MTVKHKDWIVKNYGLDFFNDFLLFISHQDNFNIDTNEYSDKLIMQFISNKRREDCEYKG